MDSVCMQEVLGKIPFVDVEAEHSILVAVLDIAPHHLTVGWADWSNEVPLLGQTYLSIGGLKSLHPLTTRAAGLLSGRLEEYGVALGPPLHEETVQDLWRLWIRRRAFRGGHELLHTVMPDSLYAPPPLVIQAAISAIELSMGAGEVIAEDARLIAGALRYDRHKPAIPPADIGFVFDLGVVMSDCCGGDSRFAGLIEGLRVFCTERKKSTTALIDILSDPTLEQILRGGGAPDAEYVPALIVFIRWKYRAQKRNGAVSIHELKAEIDSWFGRLSPKHIENALWMFGFYCGYERLAKGIYEARPRDFPFMIQHSSPLDTAIRTEQPAISVTIEPPQPEQPVNSGQPGEKPPPSAEVATIEPPAGGAEIKPVPKKGRKGGKAAGKSKAATKAAGDAEDGHPPVPATPASVVQADLKL